MRFSLKNFFEELDEIMSDNTIDEQDRLRELENAIVRNKEDADRCGHLNR